MSISTSIFQPSILVGGAFQDALGVPVSFGYLLFTLSSDSNVSVLGGLTGQQIASGVVIKIFLDGIGNAQNSSSIQQSLWANEALNPSGTFYLVRLFNSSGLEVWNSPKNWSLPYQSTIDLGTITGSVPGNLINVFVQSEADIEPLG
jgi:hypothetical protein